ncbi:MAG: type II/IV secretion system protein [Planctomycetaceae bacterium]|nr:type II/IV secretion system protein [Planctomycetaceae bacterium]
MATPHEGLRDELTELLDVVGPGKVGDVVLERAFELSATDLHLEPTGDGLRIRMRVDGLLHEIARLPQSAASPMISRFKVLAGMDITERRFAQDGHISLNTRHGKRDVRVGSGPTIHGERVVLRLMPDQEHFTQLDGLGFDNSELSAVRRCLAAPYGLILVVGPVGSGKSTSVYSFLQELNSPNKSIVTIEDPVERHLPGACQIQVEPKIGFNFADALRCVLRQDPDIMMVGEIRDAETAQIACRSALTGVLVLSTLHANNTASAIDVLHNFGVPRMVIADCLRGIISQRLVLKVCEEHREEYIPDEPVCQMLDVDPSNAGTVKLVRGIPADKNFRTGYSGRCGVYEVMEINKSLQRGILQGSSATELMELAELNGMKTLARSIRDKVLARVTSMDQFHATALSIGE